MTMHSDLKMRIPFGNWRHMFVNQDLFCILCLVCKNWEQVWLISWNRNHFSDIKTSISWKSIWNLESSFDFWKCKWNLKKFYPGWTLRNGTTCVHSSLSCDNFEYTHTVPPHEVHVKNEFSDRIFFLKIWFEFLNFKTQIEISNKLKWIFKI